MNGPRWFLRVLACVLPAVLTAAASAHDLGVTRAELRELSQGRYRLELLLPHQTDALDRTPVLPDRCTLDGPVTVLRRPGVAVLQFSFTCRGEPLGLGDRIGLPWKRDGAFVAAVWQDGSSRSSFFTAEPGSDGVTVSVDELRTQSIAPQDVARRYFVLGIEHILTGWDHLAFVLALCLIARGWRLVKLVTGFTLGHSLSLALAAFGVLRLPPPATEACIAMSIALVAREALLPQQERHQGTGLVFAFGLLHGLGFAGALKEVGIGPAELLLGLLTFNLGVEAGQLAFVGAVLGVMTLGGRLPGASAWRTACAIGIGSMGVFWTLERIVAFSPVAAAIGMGLLIAVIGLNACWTSLPLPPGEGRGEGGRVQASHQQSGTTTLFSQLQ